MNIPHTIIRSARRTLQLEISPKAELIIRAPKRMSERRILKFTQEKEQWIEKTIAKMRAKKEKMKKNCDEFFFLGKRTKVYVQKQKIPVVLVGDVLFFDEKAWQEKEKYFEKFCRDFLRKKAEKLIPEYEKKIGVLHSGIRISGAKTRWGSCSSKKNISLSWRLMMSPEEVINYVIAHEAAHLKEMNHSKNFWDTVEKICPEYKVQKKWLKEHGHGLQEL